MMDMGIDLSNIVEITVWDCFHICQFLIFVQEAIETPLAREILEPSEGEGFGGTIRTYAEEVIEIRKVLAKIWDSGE